MKTRLLKLKIYFTSPNILAFFNIWIALRLLLFFWGAFVSTLSPHTPIEQAILLWPPQSPFNTWLNRVFLAPWERWDTTYYIGIAAQGYALENGTIQFHPLFAWTATPLVWLGLHPLFALIIVSSVAGLGFLISFYHLSQLDLAPRSAQISTLLVIFTPFAFALFLPYSEALFLWCTTLSLYWARKKNWGWAGLMGALSVLTRQQGLFLLIPLMWELWESCDYNVQYLKRNWKNAIPLLFIPLGYSVWILFRALLLNDLHIDFSSLHTITYSLLISPSAVHVVPSQTFMWPWQAFWIALQKLWQAPDIDIVVNIVGGLYFLSLVILSWKKLRPSYKLYITIIVLVSFSYQTGEIHPYMGLLRHLSLAFPVFIGLASWAQPKTRHVALMGIGIFGIFFLIMLYILHVWVP